MHIEHMRAHRAHALHTCVEPMHGTLYFALLLRSLVCASSSSDGLQQSWTIQLHGARPAHEKIAKYFATIYSSYIINRVSTESMKKFNKVDYRSCGWNIHRIICFVCRFKRPWKRSLSPSNTPGLSTALNLESGPLHDECTSIYGYLAHYIATLIMNNTCIYRNH